MCEILKVKNIEKNYKVERPLVRQLLRPFEGTRIVRALNSVSFSVRDGDILGVVGPNGAGKTTLMRILADLLKADKGMVEISGYKIGESHDLRRKIGYVSSDERSFFWRLTARENLEFFGSLYGLSYKNCSKKISKLLSIFKFEERADHQFMDYSAGMRKKVSIMRSLLHEPEVLLLDEITNSLDPDSARDIKTLIREYISKQDNRCAVWSTHRLEEIGQICDNVLMICSGNVDYIGGISDYIKQESRRGRYLLKTKNMDGQLESFRQWLEGKATVKIQNNSKGHSEIKIDDLSEEEFGQIVSMAVKDYGAFVLFAGCIEKENDLDFWPEAN